MTYQLHHGNMLDILPMIERESIDAIVTDPPYGLVEPRSLRSFGYELEHGRTEESKIARRGGFMGKSWDHGVPGEHFWREAYRVAKPGAHLLAFGGTRTFHRLACAIEDAGWEIRDTVMWVYGQGFPKSHDVSKAIDREARAEREVIGPYQYDNRRREGSGPLNGDSTYGQYGRAPLGETSPATPAAEWDGWGTALKPAWEPIIVARKPLQGTVAENVQRYGTGAMNVDACRIETNGDKLGGGMVSMGRPKARNEGWDRPWMHDQEVTERKKIEAAEKVAYAELQGRWPANLIHDGSAEVLAGFPMRDGPGYYKDPDGNSVIDERTMSNINFADAYKADARRRSARFSGQTGSAARFFYCAKASKQDRDEGLEEFVPVIRNDGRDESLASGDVPQNRSNSPDRNFHPTVKPTALMRYLCRLVTPPAGVILDPFMGSGSTGKAAILEGFNFVGVDTEIEYVEIAARRIEHACGKVGIVIEQPMIFETKREMVDRPKQLILL